jgi:flagellin
MGLRIQNNIAAFNSHKNLQIADKGLSKSLQRLSSGFRINGAADDAAGLAVSMRFRSQIKSLQQASRNTSEATSLLQVAEGATEQITNILQRMKELATQAASSNTGSADRGNINKEVSDLEDEIDRIATSTKYAGSTLIDGTFGSTSVSDLGSLTATNGIDSIDVSSATSVTDYGITVSTVTTDGQISITDGVITQTLDVIDLTGLEKDTLNFTSFGIKITVDATFQAAAEAGIAADTMTTGAASSSTFQVGYENAGDNRISFDIGNMTKDGLTADVDLSTQSGAQSALASIDTAIDQLASERAVIGRSQNRLGFASANLSSTIENFSAAESVIRDADMAFETISFTKNQILLQAGTAMLAQANSAPQSILSLLG